MPKWKRHSEYAELQAADEIMSLEELMDNENHQLMLEEHAGSAVSDLEGVETAVLLGLESVPEETFWQRREERRAVRHRWS